MVKKSRSLQGGNQVHNYDYRITVASYKSEPVKVQVWDRLPRAEAEAVAVSLVETTPKLSEDSAYLPPAPENLLRWDLRRFGRDGRESGPETGSRPEMGAGAGAGGFP